VNSRAAKADSVSILYRPDATGAFAGSNFVVTREFGDPVAMSWPTTVEKRY
jgi:hypothetical protein